MRRSKEDTARTRQEIVEAASRLFRSRGIAGVSVADVMAEVGLTVGGFYRHFDSKDALVAEAIDLASRTTSAVQVKSHDVIGAYLSLEHAQHPELGCPVAALCSEVHREAKGTRGAFTAAVQRMLAVAARLEGDRARQIQHTAAAVGGLVLARATQDPRFAEEILRAVQAGLKPASSAGRAGPAKATARASKSPRARTSTSAPSPASPAAPGSKTPGR
jgi:TetR/AcrR family transcriptional repressor of nem operon